MVWNAEQSPLYQSVDRFNSGSCQQTAPQEKACETPCEKPQPEIRNEPCRSQPPPHNGSCGAHNSSGNLIQRITSDRDFMLIAALILLLWHEKADMKLIAALAFILLG